MTTLQDIEKSLPDVQSKTDEHLLVVDNFPYTLSLRIESFVDEKEQHRFIKNVERLVRVSYEYKLWRDFVSNVMKENMCVITHEKDRDVTVEIHHHVPSLYTLVKGVILTKFKNKENFCSYDVATKVIEIHYENRLGYVPLATTIHEKFHNDRIEIPMSLVKGDYKWALENLLFDEHDWEVLNSRLRVEGNPKTSWVVDSYPGLKEAACQ